MYRLAFAVAILLTPTLAFSWGEATRDVTAEIVADASAYVGVADQTPVLTVLNGYTDDAIRYTHNGETGTTYDIVVTKTSTTFAWLVLTATSATGVAVGGSHTARAKDTRVVHSSGTYPIDIEVEVTVRDASSNAVGFVAVTRTVQVVV